MSRLDKRTEPCSTGQTEGRVDLIPMRAEDPRPKKPDKVYIARLPKDDYRAPIFRRGLDWLPLAHASLLSSRLKLSAGA